MSIYRGVTDLPPRSAGQGDVDGHWAVPIRGGQKTAHQRHSQVTENQALVEVSSVNYPLIIKQSTSTVALSKALDGLPGVKPHSSVLWPCKS